MTTTARVEKRVAKILREAGAGEVQAVRMAKAVARYPHSWKVLMEETVLEELTRRQRLAKQLRKFAAIARDDYDLGYTSLASLDVHEDSYTIQFGSFQSNNRPSIAELLEHIADEVQGRPVGTIIRRTTLQRFVVFRTVFLLANNGLAKRRPPIKLACEVATALLGKTVKPNSIAHDAELRSAWRRHTGYKSGGMLAARL